jgi:DmsE family decaheme c-type cytochrome
MLKRSNKTSRSSITIRIVILLMVGVLVGILFFIVQQPKESLVYSQSANEPVQQNENGQDCKRCHTAIVESHNNETHGKTGKFLKDSRATSCESCHGNGDLHIRSKKPEDIKNPRKLPASQTNSSCLQCHSQDEHIFAWQGGEHDRKDMSCLSCHSQHNSKSEEKMLVGSTTEETCLTCHTSIRKAQLQRSTHLFRTEQHNQKVGCTSCHNPHGGEGDKMLAELTINDTCYACHAEKRGPYLWDHPPVRENCMNCHAPHGSNNAKLLTARAHLSCQQCHVHMLPRHSTTAGKPLDIWSLNRGCVNCHSQIHGSNHPGGRTLTR